MIIKCKMCGGDIQFNSGDTVGQCDHCGCTTTFPKLPDEQRTNLFNRANHFRRQCEFDKAMAAYEHIVEEDDTDAEAHWGIVLSKYGIEYVEDPVTHERIPTCHRAQVISILSDEDYQNALKNAPDTHSREVYEKEAKRIAEIQKGILAISSQEKPYDVFICYKETDDNGSRTKDSALAQDIYYQLINEGYKVFFSRITLEDKLGQEYEPYIFAALNSAKVMLVVGTKPENFSAVWVKNEWSRFLAIMKNDRKRVLIPCYRDMDPYDLPEELSSLQSQDMSKIGFMQDIIHGVKKVLGTDKQKAESATVQTAGPGVSSLHKRAVLFLEDSDWDSATDYFDRILDIDPEYAPAYIGKVQVKNQMRREADLARCKAPLSSDPDYQKALRFADDKQKEIYSGYNRAILERIDLEQKEAVYREAVALENRAAVEKEFITAAQKFDAAGEIRDAKERAANCRAKAASAKAEAEKAAAAYKEQMERERRERERQEEERRIAEEKRQQEEAERLRKEEELRKEKKKQIIKICSVIAAVAVLIIGGYLVYEKVIHPKIKYDRAQALLNDGKLDEAYAAFNDMLDYGDSADKLLEIQYKKAEGLLAEGKLTEAKQYYGLASGYSDAEQQIKNIDEYIAAETACENKDYISAGEKYQALGGFLDSAEKYDNVSAILYTQATKAIEEEDYKQAYSLLTVLGDYSDCPALMESVDKEYEAAIKHWQDGEKLQAEQELQVLSGWKVADEHLISLRLEIADDAANNEDYDTALEYYGKLPATTDVQAKQTTATQGKIYQQACKALESGDLETAYKLFLSAKDHKDAEQQAEKLEKYQQANELLASGKYEEARTAFAGLEGFLDSAEQLEQCNQTLYIEATDLLEQGKTAEAYEAFESISDYSDSASVVETIDENYTLALQLLEEKKYDEAIATFRKLHNYKSSEEKLNEAQYQKAEWLLNNGDYEEAIAVYTSLWEYADSQEKINIARYKAAEKLYEDKDIDGAIEAFEAISAYSDSQERANAIRYEKANALWQSGELQLAAEEFKTLGNYKSAASDLVAVNAELINKSITDKDYDAALVAYQSMEQTDEVKEYEYQLAQLAYDEGCFDVSVKIYEYLGQYQLSLSKLPIARYAWADQLFKNEEYEAAAEQFVLLGDMTDSAERAIESTYQYACQLLDSEEYDKAKELFITIPEYKDANTMVLESVYRKAGKLFAEKDYSGAEQIYEILVDYKDSSTRMKECIYSRAEALFAEEKYEDARNVFLQVEYSDSKEKANECAYRIATAYIELGQYAEAVEMLGNCADYKDSATQITECRYLQGKIMYEKGDYQAALSFFDDSDYMDSKQLAEQCHFELGRKLQINGDVEGAIGQYAYAVDVDEASTALLAIAKDYATINEIEKSIQVLWLIRTEEEAKDLLNELGILKEQSDEVDLALLAYISAGEDSSKLLALASKTNPNDFEKRISGCSLLSEEKEFASFIRYHYAEILRSNKQYDEAAQIFETISEYSDSKVQISETVYQKAAELNAAGDYQESYDAYMLIYDYRDVPSIISSDSHLSSIAKTEEEREQRKAPFKTIGGTVIFGHYEQDGIDNGAEGIEWIVIAIKGDKSLLLSKYVLDCQLYHNNAKFDNFGMKWSGSFIRNWLNHDFINTAFSSKERKMILVSKIYVPGYTGGQIWDERQAETTEDKVFLLTKAEATKYLDSSTIIGVPTQFAVDKGAVKTNNACRWLLREPKTCVSYDGSFDTKHVIGFDHDGIRPALWIDLNSEMFYVQPDISNADITSSQSFDLTLTSQLKETGWGTVSSIMEDETSRASISCSLFIDLVSADRDDFSIDNCTDCLINPSNVSTDGEFINVSGFFDYKVVHITYDPLSGNVSYCIEDSGKGSDEFNSINEKQAMEEKGYTVYTNESEEMQRVFDILIGQD